MPKKELLLGFDAREMWYYDDVKAMGARETGSTSFLREGILKGLTVDSSIWPCVFNDGNYPGLSDNERKSLGLGTLKLPEDIGSNSPLWENLEHLENHLKEHESEIIKPYWIIAITLSPAVQRAYAKYDEWPYSDVTVPPILDPAWACVGFDIADQSTESHLTGTTFSGEEDHIESLFRRWGPFLNKYHLFDDMGQAIAFKEQVAERNDPVNRPYYVYGIWLIKEIKSF